MSERKLIFEKHDLILGHIVLKQDGDNYFLLVGKRDLHFRNGELVASGITPCSLYQDCLKCAEDGFGGDQSKELE